MAESTPAPRVFISYSWESQEHKQWVRILAEKLVKNGVDVRLDQWHVKYGESVTRFMEEEIKQANLILVICTPTYAQKSNARKGGVGYEQQILSVELFRDSSQARFIPILRVGEPDDIPVHLGGRYFADFRQEHDFDVRVEDLVRAIYDQPRFGRPPLGPPPSFETITDSRFSQFYKTPSPGDIHMTDYSQLAVMSREEIKATISHFKDESKSNPGNAESNFHLGLCYLQLQLFDLALKNFKEVIQKEPDDAEGYYYYALSLVRGRRPKTLALKIVKDIENHVQTAIQLDDSKAKYLLLSAIIKHDYYMANGLSLSPPHPETLLQKASTLDVDVWEAQRLLSALILREGDFLDAINKVIN